MNKLLSHPAESSVLDLQSASVLVVGCGLIGTSIAMALKQAFPTVRLFGMDANDTHRSLAENKGVFEQIQNEWPAEPLDLAILAVPAMAAAAFLEQACQRSRWVMDVCSVKGPLCEAAADLELTSQFAPTHPMAGLASEGPLQATAELFVGQPWLMIQGYPVCMVVAPMIETIGARIIWLENDSVHDEAMAVVSHTIHLTSLSAMLAYETAADELNFPLATLTGPGFRDITRLAESPSGFWIDTLLSNRVAILQQIERTKMALDAFGQTLATQDREGLKTLLDAARCARTAWKETPRGK